MSDHRAEHDLLGAWALDAVNDVERAAVERAIRDDPDFAAEAKALLETVALLAAGNALAPPEELRASVLDEAAATPQLPPVSRRHSDVSRPRARAARWRWLAAAAALLAVAVPSTVAVQQAQRAERAEGQVTAIAEALTDPEARLLAEDVSGGGRAVAVVSAGSALFTADALPTPADEQVYQLWVIEDGQPSSAGILQLHNGLATTQVRDVPDAAVLALTLEPAGGSARPTTTPVLTLATG